MPVDDIIAAEQSQDSHAVLEMNRGNIGTVNDVYSVPPEKNVEEIPTPQGGGPAAETSYVF